MAFAGRAGISLARQRRAGRVLSACARSIVEPSRRFERLHPEDFGTPHERSAYAAQCYRGPLVENRPKRREKATRAADHRWPARARDVARSVAPGHSPQARSAGTRRAAPDRPERYPERTAEAARD